MTPEQHAARAEDVRWLASTGESATGAGWAS